MRRLLQALMLLSMASPALADTLTVAVAANFKTTLEALGAAFQTRSGHRLNIASGPTGKLYAQIVHGAPFDLFLAADGRSTARLEAEGLILAGSRFVYARGQLVLFAPGLPPGGEPLALLRNGGFRHLAIANPKTAPYGLAAEQALRKWGVLDRLRPKIVYGENIGQTYQFVATGNAELGFVALSYMLDPKAPAPQQRWWRVPQEDYGALDQEAVILKRSEHPDVARRFVAFLRSPAGRRIIEASGYAVP